MPRFLGGGSSKSEMSKVTPEGTASSSGQENKSKDALIIPKDRLGLHPLVKPSPEAVANGEVIDIVAVHGLGGDAFDTWTASSTKKLWLYDFLPDSIYGKNARISTFGYDARAFTAPWSQSTKDSGRVLVFAEQLLNDVDDSRTTPEEKDRPIIFVAHSLGGLVVKSALNYAHSRASLYGNLLSHTQSIVFFGTPHMGSNKAAWLSFLQHLTMHVASATPSVDTLETWSTPLMDMSIFFAEYADKIQLTTFFEEKKTWGLMIVPEASARMYKQLEVYRGLDADHLQICKFASTESKNCKTVLKRFEKIMGDIIEKRRSDAQAVRLPAVPSGGLSSTETPSAEVAGQQGAGDDLRKRLDALRNNGNIQNAGN